MPVIMHNNFFALEGKGTKQKLKENGMKIMVAAMVVVLMITMTTTMMIKMMMNVMMTAVLVMTCLMM
jgi:hypothetical protein